MYKSRIQKNSDVTRFSIPDFIQIEERFNDWFPLLSDNSGYIVGQYIKSNRHGTERGNQNERGKNPSEIVDVKLLEIYSHYCKMGFRLPEEQII